MKCGACIQADVDAPLKEGEYVKITREPAVVVERCETCGAAILPGSPRFEMTVWRDFAWG